MRAPTLQLSFIIDTLDSINEHTPTEKAVFMSDANAQDATLMRLQDIGEQLARLRDKSPDFYEQNETDEWHKLIGLRNIISHGYREVDFEVIWDIVQNHLATFKKQITDLTE